MVLREKSPYTKKDASPQSNNQNSLPSSANAYNSYTTKEQSEINHTRKAISVYDQLHEQDFWCPRCNSKMEEPRLLPCLHSVCNNCVEEFMSKDYHGNVSMIPRNDDQTFRDFFKQIINQPLWFDLFSK